ncbi:unnamed protein product [Rhizophagus irregularis]|nr:unnamed protein product [Rhizophagus irregularis]
MWKFSQPSRKNIFRKITQKNKENEKTSIINLKCCLKNGQDEKTFIISPCKEDKVAILEFAVKTLLANQGYQVLFLGFDLYVNDSK